DSRVFLYRGILLSRTNTTVRGGGHSYFPNGWIKPIQFTRGSVQNVVPAVQQSEYPVTSALSTFLTSHSALNGTNSGG
ncbi:hypothetical protein F5141DRAFT_1035134, partial [Pisolithus sp. B1]